MASPSTSASTGVTAKSAVDPILRNALRYTISAREYSLLHKYVISRSRALKKRAPTVDSASTGSQKLCAPLVSASSSPRTNTVTWRSRIDALLADATG